MFNLNDLGRVGLAGDFSGISLYEFTSQAQSYSNGSQSLLTQLPNGIFTSLGLADSVINAMCEYVNKDGADRRIVVGGNFTSLGGVVAKGIALYDPDNNKITTLDDFNGKVNALLCDGDANRVYVGGQFSLNKSANAIVWEDGNWKVLPFEGFTGPVSTITRSNNATILFGGNFDGLQNFSTPSVKDAQTLNIVSAQVTAEQTSDVPGFNDPAAITCTNGTEKQWLLRDGQPGSWTATFRYELFPTKLRLINANQGGRSTSNFRFTAFPLGGILNLTYTDPGSGQKRHCEAYCPLAASNEPQDFEFVNVVGMKSFRLDILTFRGAGGGLSSVQLFQDDIFTYAIPGLNEPACAAGPVRSASSASGSWSETQVNPQGDSDYLSADISAANSQTSQIVFEPHIEQKGKYQVLVYTPGCIQDGTCGTRGRMVVGGTVTKDGKPIQSVSLFQTNNNDKYDIVYEGDVDPAGADFRPTITISPDPQQTQAVVKIVAQKVQFRLIGDAKGSAANSSNSSSGLNGIYEYDPRNVEISNSADSRLQAAGLQLNDNASVVDIVVKDDLTYVAGNFTARDNNFQHFFIIDKNSDNLPNVPEGGLGGLVNTMVLVGDLLYVGGSFTGTKAGSSAGMAFIGAYDISKSSWVSLGGGVDGQVTEIVPIRLNLTTGLTDCLAVSGEFTNVRPNNNANNTVSADGFAIWVPSKTQWLETMKTEDISITGLLSAVVKSANDYIYAGSVQSNTVSSSGLVYLLDDNDKIDVAQSSLAFAGSPGSGLRKRAVVSQNITGVVTGIFFKEGGKNLTVLGGRFEANGKNGPVRDLAFIDGNSAAGDVTGPSSEFDAQSTILALHILDRQLYVGGSLEGTNGISGIAIWDMDKMRLADNQPQPLVGDNVTVHQISHRPDSKDVFVAGDFNSAGSLTCANLCIYQSEVRQWRGASPDTPGTINVMRWAGKTHLIVGGDMRFNGTRTYIALFDAEAGRYSAVNGDISTIPGPVVNIALDSESSNSFFISGTSSRDGSPYLMKLNNGRFVLLGMQNLNQAVVVYANRFDR